MTVAGDRYSQNSLSRLLGRINSVTFRDEAGELEYFGQRMVMVRSDTFKLVREELAKRQASGTGNIVLGLVGRIVGRGEAEALLSYLSGETRATRFSPDFIRNSVEETNMGFGKLNLDELDTSSKTVKVSSNNSFEAGTPSDSPQTTCFFLLGYLEGLFSGLLNGEIRGAEVSCKGKGDVSCVFHLKPSFERSKWKL
jgi:predicted hydrocarbon binding protein